MSLTGAFEAPSSDTGRGTATFTLTPQPGTNSSSLNAVYYIVSANKILLIETDNARIGEIERQTGTYSTALLNAPVVLQMSGGNGNDKQSGVAGLISPDGSGSISGVFDQNMQSNINLDQAFTGTDVVDSSGRAAMTLLVGATSNDLIAYLFGQNEAFVIQTTGSDALYGSFKPQTGGPFHGSIDRRSLPKQLARAGPTLVRERRRALHVRRLLSFTLVSDFNYWYADFTDTLGQNNDAGTYTMDTNGQVAMSINGLPFSCWAISPDEMVCIDTVSNQDSLPILMKFDRVSGGATNDGKKASSPVFQKQLRAPKRPRS